MLECMGVWGVGLVVVVGGSVGRNKGGCVGGLVDGWVSGVVGGWCGWDGWDVWDGMGGGVGGGGVGGGGGIASGPAGSTMSPSSDDNSLPRAAHLRTGGPGSDSTYAHATAVDCGKSLP